MQRVQRVQRVHPTPVTAPHQNGNRTANTHTGTKPKPKDVKFDAVNRSDWNWKTVVLAKGKTYWYNKKTKKVRWTDPSKVGTNTGTPAKSQPTEHQRTEPIAQPQELKQIRGRPQDDV